MAVHWYYASNRQQMGPVSWEELCRLASSGFLRPTDLVWHEGLPDWARADTQGLFTSHAGEPRRIPAAEAEDWNVEPSPAAKPAPARPVPRENDFERPRRRSAPDFDDHDDEFDERPRRRRPPQGMPVGLKIGLIIGGVIFVLLIVAVVLVFMLRGGAGAAYDVPNGGPLTINDTLRRSDRRDIVRRQPCRIYNVNLQAKSTYIIDMRSFQIDSYLRLEDPNGANVAEDDDSGGNLNARIIYTPAQSGAYRVIATTFDGRTGPFTLSIRKQ